MAGTVVVLDISETCPNRVHLFTCIFGWIDSLSKQSPLERVALCTTFNPRNPAGLPPQVKDEPHVKDEPQVKIEGRPAKRKRESPSDPSGSLTVLVPLKRYLQDMSMVQTAMVSLEHVQEEPCCSWSVAVGCAAQMLLDCFGEAPVGQIVVVSDHSPVLDPSELSMLRLPLGIRPHQFTLTSGTDATASVAALRQFVNRHHGTSSVSSDLDGLMHAMDEMQIECLRPHDAQIAMGHLRTPIQVIPSIAPPVLSKMGCAHQPGVFSIVGFLPLSEAGMLSVLSVHHAVLFSVGMGGDGAELYIGLQTVLQRDSLAAIVRLADNSLAIFTSLGGSTSSGGSRRCLVLSLIDPRAEAPLLPQQSQGTKCFEGTEIAMPVSTMLEAQRLGVSKAIAMAKAPSKLKARVEQVATMAEGLCLPSHLQSVRELIPENSEATKVLDAAHVAIVNKFSSK